MVTAVPALETVIDAVHTALNAVVTPDPILKCDHRFEDDVEFIEINSYVSGGSMNLWVIDVEPSSPFDGQGVGEQYDRYNIRIRYWSLRTNNADWAKEARIRAKAVVEALTNNAAVFAISGQVQLFTGTTVSMEGPGAVQIRDRARAAGQMVYQVILRLQVEARMWS